MKTIRKLSVMPTIADYIMQLFQLVSLIEEEVRDKKKSVSFTASMEKKNSSTLNL